MTPPDSDQTLAASPSQPIPAGNLSDKVNPP
ncbi:hypothetical protein FHR33_000344 [Nonomuraea dietziae]|uniref:Uncharacterized protein n=1 Tax=Nonomuraea dietziae TaxID=65515 RepID=A0A7W5UWV9_9ACTN|nr:hypothetical protein [Nonomuraea dietziae]